MINKGSWICTVEVDNKYLEEKILNGTIKGFSLFSYAGGETSYNDVEDKSDVRPLFISFVKYPANQVVFEVLDKESYISKMEAIKLADDDKSILQKIKELVSSIPTTEEEKEETKEKTDEEPVVEKAKELEDEVVEVEEVKEETPKETTETENPNEAVTEEVPVEEKEEEEPVVEKACEEEEEPVVEKDEEMVVGDMQTETPVVPEVPPVDTQAILNAIADLRYTLLEVLNPAEEEIIEEVPVEEPETYIIKQATQKTDVVENVGKKEPKPYFDILGRKL